MKQNFRTFWHLEAQLILNQKFKNMEVPRENGAAIL
jgi:hypothetical protein